MTDNAPAVASDFRHAIELLSQVDDQATLRAATALRRWLGGESLEAAAGLVGDWRERVAFAARDETLKQLAKIRIDLDAQALAKWIIEQSALSVPGLRRDGAQGYVDDLVRLGCVLSVRHLRRLIGDIRRGVAIRERAVAMNRWRG